MFRPDTELGVAKEVVRLAEKRLDAQLQIISALAQRAGNLANILGAGATAILAGEIAFMNGHGIQLNWAYFLIMLLAPAFAYAGCMLCGSAAGTSTFHVAGNIPKSWVENCKDIELAEALCGEAENYQNYIEYNEQILSKYAWRLRWGLRFGAASPLIMATVGFCFLATRAV